MNRHDVIIWDASEEDLSLDYLALSARGLHYATEEQKPKVNMRMFAEDLNDLAKDKQLDDETRLFLKEVASQIKHLGYKALTLEMPIAWQRPLRALVKAASKYSIIIADEELVMAFLPNEEVLPDERAWRNLLWELGQEDKLIAEHAAKGLPQSVEDYASWLRVFLDVELGKYGFKRTEKPKSEGPVSADYFPMSWYCREVEIGQQYVRLEHRGELASYGNYTSSFMICPVVSDVYQKFSFDKHNARVFYIQMRQVVDVSKYGTSSPLSIKLTQEYISLIASAVIKPFLDTTRDIKGLDKLVNGFLSSQPESYIELIRDVNLRLADAKGRKLTPQRFKAMGFYCPQSLIIARLANNPQFDKLMRFFEAEGHLGANQQARATEWPKLVQYLRDEVKQA